MFRKLAIAVSLVGTAVVAFISVSQAAGPAQSEFPLFNLPAVSLSPADAQLANQVLSEETAAAFGITSDAYVDARLLASTSAGPFYVIPGTKGVCLFTPGEGRGVVACSTLDSSHVFSLRVPDPNGDTMVGAGITSADSRELVAVIDGTHEAAVPRVPGGFAITADLGITLGMDVEFVER